MKFAPLTAAVVAAVSLGSVAPAFAQPRSYDARYDRAHRDYADYCRQKKKSGQKSGAIIGALAGAVIGSNVAGRGAKTEGAVVGALAGAAVGSNIGRSAAKTRCDKQGAYWSRADTYPYRGSYYDARRDRGYYEDTWYERRQCRWVEAYDGEWVRACPDRNGRYRLQR
jgi:uncharacterized protein YcfJ